MAARGRDGSVHGWATYIQPRWPSHQSNVYNLPTVNHLALLPAWRKKDEKWETRNYRIDG